MVQENNMKQSTPPIEKRGKKIECKTCQGYGFWAVGMHTSMGEMDSKSGFPTLPCPECGANPNPITSSEK